MSRALATKVLPLTCIAALIGITANAPSHTGATAPVLISPPPLPMPEATPPKQDDYAELPTLVLTDLIKRPVGPEGLEFSDHVKALEGQRIKVTGFMIHTDWADRTTFMLADYPSNVSEREFGACDDLPPMQLFVKTPPGKETGFQRGVLQLVGTLRLGPADEPYDRRSFIRLEVDPDLKTWHVSPQVVSRWSEAELAQYKALCVQQNRISCTSCALMTDPKAPAFVSPTTTINTRKNKL